MKDLECPNCGNANPHTISEGQYKCKFCDTEYVNESILHQKRAREKEAAKLKSQEIKANENATVQAAKTAGSMSKRVMLFVIPFMLAVFGYVGYMGMKSMGDTKKQQEELMKSLTQSAEEIKGTTDTLKK
jgi:hypothetical protein